MRKAEGFITADGTFFEREKDAALHEAETRLRNRLSAEYPQLSQESFFGILVNVAGETGDYINALYAANSTERAETEDEIGGSAGNGSQAEVDDGLGHVASTEEDLTSLLQLPTRGLEHVSDMGSGPRSAKVSNRRKKHGA